MLGEPCDTRILLDHYGKTSPHLNTDQEMDFKSESAAIYVLVSKREEVKGSGNILSGMNRIFGRKKISNFLLKISTFKTRLMFEENYFSF